MAKKNKKTVTREQVENPEPEEMTPEAERQVKKVNNAFDLPDRVAKVEHISSGEVFNVVGIVDKGREFICALTRTQIQRGPKGQFLKDRVTGEYLTETIVTGHRTYRGRDVFRIA